MPAGISAEEATVPPIASVTTAAILFNKTFRRRSGVSVGAGASSLFSLAPIATVSVAVTVNTVVVQTVLTTVFVEVVVISVAVIVDVYSTIVVAGGILIHILQNVLASGLLCR